jgi:hypothetical protein
VSGLDGQIEAISRADLERYRDAEWALHDPQVQQLYEGRWVIAYQRRIIAHGDDPQNVMQEANRLVKDAGHRVVFCARDDPNSWLEGSSAADTELANG